jgi:hypothetical protein
VFLANRQPLLVGEIKERFWVFMGGIAKQNELKPLCIGGVADDVICYFPCRLLCRSLKRRNRLRSFQEEYVSLLKKHGIGFEERHLSD